MREGKRLETDQLAQILPLNILVVDDDYVNRVVISGLLKKLGYIAEVTDGGATALELFNTKKFDLILIDCHMPAPDGYTTTRNIRSSKNPQNTIRIVGVSASIIMGDTKKCLEAGMNAAIPKPVSLNSLNEIILQVCGAHSQFLPGIAFDQKKLESRFRGMEDLIEELVQAFKISSPDLLSNLEKAIISGDPAALELSAHTMNGVLANFYPAESREIAADLERMGRERDMTHASERFADLVAKVEILSNELSTFLSERNAS